MYRRPSPWEVELLTDIDDLWLSIASDDKASGAPLLDEDGNLDRGAVASSVKSLFSAFAKK